MKRIPAAAALLLVLGLAVVAGCHKDPPSAKDEMLGKIYFSSDNFNDDAKKFKNFEEFKKANKLINELVVTTPESSLRYYAVFQEPLGAERYIVQVFDKTDGAAAHTENREAKPSTGQTTGGWTFQVEQWPMPTDSEKIVANEVWIKPGHRYEVVILKPLATGEFSIADATPAPTPVAKKGPAKKKKTH